MLRHREGDVIRITDGKGAFYDAAITRADARKCAFEITGTEAVAPRPFHIEIALSPTKNLDRVEWFVEKAVEIGIQRISFIECRRSERRHLNTARLVKIAASAMKQSLKAWLPQIGGMVPLHDFLAAANAADRFIAVVDPSHRTHLHHRASKGKDTMVLIGPEGDFAPDEVERAIENGFEKVSLGPSRLRTETAALVACHILNLANEPA